MGTSITSEYDEEHLLLWNHAHMLTRRCFDMADIHNMDKSKGTMNETAFMAQYFDRTASKARDTAAQYRCMTQDTGVTTDIHQ